MPTPDPIVKGATPSKTEVVTPVELGTLKGSSVTTSIGEGGFKPPGGTLTITEGSVGTVRLEKQFEPTQQAGMLLAGGVGVVATLAILVIIVAWVVKAPSLSAPSGLTEMDPTKAKVIIDNLKSLNDLAVDSATKMFDTIIARSLLPVFTAILGYIFGIRSSRSGSGS